VNGHPVQVATIPAETRAAFDGAPLGRFVVLADETENVQADETATPCPLCLTAPLFHLSVPGNRFGRVVAALEEPDDFAVEVMPSALAVMACQRCGVYFYQGDAS
jgi:hypothetical protein